VVWRNKDQLRHNMMAAAKALIIERVVGLIGMFRLGNLSHHGHRL
jgi:hypothetical protein